MKNGEKNPNKQLYNQLRTYSREQLWKEEVPRFDRAEPEERLERVALVRAIGVVFSETGSAQEKDAVREWLRGLLQDPSEKIRRYAMTALPKIGAGLGEETELLTLLRKTPLEREKKFLGQALQKIGGAATLEELKGQPEGSGNFALQTEQKVRANVARSEGPGALEMESVFSDFAAVRIHLRCRRGLEKIVRDEVEESAGAGGKFRLEESHSGLVAIRPVRPFSLSELYALRCFATAGFVLGNLNPGGEAEIVESLAWTITSPLSRTIMETFTEGPARYRLDFVSKGHQRGAVRLVTNRAYALCPSILNDPHNALWTIAVHPARQAETVELSPRLIPDPRLSYRLKDVPAASHPPLAACMARLGGRRENEIVWDPFCGSGLELVERALLGGVRELYGTDQSPEAVEIAAANFSAAKLETVAAHFGCCDFRDFAHIKGLGPGRVTLIVTNPPMGKRVPIANLRGLIEDIFSVAATVLKPGGRLVFANPLRIEPTGRTLRLDFRQVVDFSGFDCRLEMYRKSGGA